MNLTKMVNKIMPWALGSLAIAIVVVLLVGIWIGEDGV